MSSGDALKDGVCEADGKGGVRVGGIASVGTGSTGAIRGAGEGGTGVAGAGDEMSAGSMASWG